VEEDSDGVQGSRSARKIEISLPGAFPNVFLRDFAWWGDDESLILRLTILEDLPKLRVVMHILKMHITGQQD
jgi:hypothetical protein